MSWPKMESCITTRSSSNRSIRRCHSRTAVTSSQAQGSDCSFSAADLSPTQVSTPVAASQRGRRQGLSSTREKSGPRKGTKRRQPSIGRHSNEISPVAPMPPAKKARLAAGSSSMLQQMGSADDTTWCLLDSSLQEVPPTPLQPSHAVSDKSVIEIVNVSGDELEEGEVVSTVLEEGEIVSVLQEENSNQTITLDDTVTGAPSKIQPPPACSDVKRDEGQPVTKATEKQIAAAAAGRPPNFQFGGPSPPAGEVFQFTGRGKSDPIAVAHHGETIYSVGSGRAPTQGSLRPVVIDGSNVAMRHGRSTTFSVKGIQLVIDYFKNRGHKVVAFVPQHRKKPSMSTDPKLLNKLEREGHVVFTPSRETDKARITSYDDRFILDYAAKNGGVVVSSDYYRDLITEKVEWREVIERRLLVPTFPDKDTLMFPDDPLGRHGPRLTKFLQF